MIRSTPSVRLLKAGAVASLLLASAGAAVAQTAPTVRVRGTVESVTASTLVVRSREGASVPIALKEGWGVSGIKAASVADIRPGTFVGAAAMGRGDGPLTAIEVLVFPAGVKSGEGHYGWDLLPESTMTNATVASTVTSVSGPVMTLTYPGGEKQIAITAETPLVTFAPAEKSDLKPGAAVFVPAQRGEDGALGTARVVVGNNGIAPPM